MLNNVYLKPEAVSVHMQASRCFYNGASSIIFKTEKVNENETFFFFTHISREDTGAGGRKAKGTTYTRPPNH